jgi:hypothetical protein
MRNALRLTTALILFAALAAASDLDGTWHFVLDTENGVREFNMSLKVEGNQVTGTMDKDVAVKGAYQGDLLQLKFPFHLEAVDVKDVLTITGRLQDGKLAGDWEIDEYSGTFEATKTE